MKLNKNGIAAKEIMISLVIIIIVIVIFFVSMLNSNDSASFNHFKKMSNKFNEEAVLTRDEDARFTDLVYLADVLLNPTLASKKENYRSPFSESQCDKYESKIYKVDNEKKVYFKCDDYLIKASSAKDKLVKIYQVGKWKEMTETDILDEETTEFTKFYTLASNRLDGYYIEREFVDKYNNLNMTEYLTLAEVTARESVLEKTYYRSIKLVEER